ncbi:hypothetical protein A7X67_10975 [Clostridium sp. W14A]|nr:hypothetical protein A7X67_10975 [Clostridium sp. W14A]
MSGVDEVKYALREDPSTICMLEDAGKFFQNYCQITVFARNIFKPEHIGQYIYFAPFTGANGKFHGNMTDVRITMEDNKMEPKFNYVTVIESEVEFRVTSTVMKHLSREYMPAWGMKSYLDYFSDRPSGLLLFLRVYRVNQAIDYKYLEKGSKGSFQLFRLYDEYENETSLRIDGLTPAISDNKFSYIKDEIIHLLKVDNSFIVEYDNTEKGRQSLNDRFEADKQLRNTHQKWENRHLQWAENGYDIDADEDFDMAQLDYDAIYKKVVELYPSMETIVEYVRNLQAARLGEYDYLLSDVHEQNDNARTSELRIFDMSVRAAVKNALYCYKNDGIDLEDAFQEACIGIIMAIKKHNDGVEGLFPSYASMWMTQVMHRDLPYYQYNYRLPIHYIDKIKKIVRELKEAVGSIKFSDLQPSDLMRLLLKYTSCNKDDASRLSMILIPAISVEELIENGFDEFFSDKNKAVDELENALYFDTIHDLLNILTERERNIIVMRFGLNSSHEYTLEEVGKVVGITRERVRQIEKKAKGKILRCILNGKLKSGLKQ